MEVSTLDSDGDANELPSRLLQMTSEQEVERHY